jgi:hypothetical protein
MELAMARRRTRHQLYGRVFRNMEGFQLRNAGLPQRSCHMGAIRGSMMIGNARIRKPVAAGGLLLWIIVFSAVRARCAEKPPIRVSICTLAQHLKSYNGKMIRVTGFVGRSEFTTIYSACGNELGVALVMRFPDEIGQHVPFRLVRDKDFKLFWQYLTEGKSIKAPGASVHILPFDFKYCTVAATFTGLFNAVSDEDALEGRGFGIGGSPFRFIVQSVSDPIAEKCPKPMPSGTHVEKEHQYEVPAPPKNLVMPPPPKGVVNPPQGPMK